MIDTPAVIKSVRTGNNQYTEVIVEPAQKTPARLVPLDENNNVVGHAIEGKLVSTASNGNLGVFMVGQEGSYSHQRVPERSRGGSFNPGYHSGYRLEIDRVIEIASVTPISNGATLSLSYPWEGTSGTYKFDALGTGKGFPTINSAQYAQRYASANVAFRPGTLYQSPIPGSGGVGSTSKANTVNAALELTTGYSKGSTEGTAAPVVLQGSSNTGFALSTSQIEAIDIARIFINYASGFRAINDEGKDRSTVIRYKLELSVNRDNAWTSNVTLRDVIQHEGLYKDAHTFEEEVSLERYKPFDDFKLIISRMDGHQVDDGGYGAPGELYTSWKNYTASSVTSVVALFNEHLNYPLTSIGQVSFNSKDFQQMPQRSYHLKGLLVKVPSNYITRDESTTGVASYNRNTSTGAVEASYQAWDGTFRSETVYTNNPAWILYDIVTNNRYGLGDFISENDIDKYALYRVARYCDELVDDGKGGLEPRYTFNTYITKAADAYKVLKDLCTNFLGMIYFLDGSIFTALEAPSAPVYNFTKANTLEGGFSYETSGSKTRINQVIVLWNNPDANYALEPLIVEDRRNIGQTQKIITEEVTAFGCTSEGQATRYGRWKLWTAANQQEIVSFSTGIQGSYITPGDIISIQDADRDSVRYGGRISSTGTLSTTEVPLDSNVTLNSGSTYELAVLFAEGSGIYTGSSSIVKGGVTYTSGELIPSINSETAAANAVDDSGNPIVVSWKEDFRTETRSVSTSSGSTDSLTVSSAFSTTPEKEDIWILTETRDGLTVGGSGKTYKVLGVAEASKNTYDIAAVEHYNEKYSAIEEDFTTYVAEPLATIVNANDIVPEVIDAFARLKIAQGGVAGESIELSWIPPAAGNYNVVDDEGNTVSESFTNYYEFLDSYEISHDIPQYESPIRVDKNTNTYVFTDVQEGKYTFAVRVINSIDNKSNPKLVTISTADVFGNIVPRLPGDIPVGGLASRSTSVGSVNGTTSFQFDNSVYGARGPHPKGAIYLNTASTTALYSQPINTLPTIVYNAQNYNGTFETQHHYIVLRPSNLSDPLLLAKYKSDASHGVPYWLDAGTGNDNTGETQLTGTMGNSANRSLVLGVGTAFTTELAIGALLRMGSNAAIVTSIESDTRVRVDRPLPAGSNLSGFTNNYHIDFVNDAVIARVYKTSSGIVSESFIGVDSTLSPQRGITFNIYRLDSNTIDRNAGSFTAPLNGNTSWGLSVPSMTSDGQVVYVSSRVLTSDGESPQDAQWSIPSIYAARVHGTDGDAYKEIKLYQNASFFP